MDELIDITRLDDSGEEDAEATGDITARSAARARRRLFETGSEFAPVTRERIVGIDAVVERVEEIAHWLDHAGRYRGHGARLEPGVLFEGPPGTGKTLLARYLATSADALFVDVRDFPRTAAVLRPDDVEALFALARDAAVEGRPVVLFWDELWSIGQRGPGVGPTTSATMAALLAELDGTRGKPDGVILVGCTGDADCLDPALLRSGRMGVHISFAPPDRDGRRALLSHFSARVESVDELDVALLAELLPATATASTIEEAVAEAWRLAVGNALRENRAPVLTQADLVTTLARRLAGVPPAFVALAPEERLRVAVHEVGHGLVALALGLELWLLSVEGGTTAGRTVTGDLGRLPSFDEVLAQLSMGLAGSVAEEVALDSGGPGAASDNLRASETALRLVELHGAGRRTGRFNPDAIVRRRGPRSPDTSEHLLADVDADARELVARADRDAERVLRRIGKTGILALAEALDARGTITGPEFAELARERIGDPARYARRRWSRS